MNLLLGMLCLFFLTKFSGEKEKEEENTWLILAGITYIIMLIESACCRTCSYLRNVSAYSGAEELIKIVRMNHP